MPILAALLLLVAVGLGVAWFLRANPSTVARRLRIGLVLLGALGVGGLLIFGVRFLPSFLPELFGLGGVVVTGLIARAFRHRPSGGFSTPGNGQRTERIPPICRPGSITPPATSAAAWCRGNSPGAFWTG